MPRKFSRNLSPAKINENKVCSLWSIELRRAPGAQVKQSGKFGVWFSKGSRWSKTKITQANLRLGCKGFLLTFVRTLNLTLAASLYKRTRKACGTSGDERQVVLARFLNADLYKGY